MRLTPKIIRIISIKFCFINFAVCLLNAKVVVEHTYGILSFCANNFPQKLNESDTMQSGLKSLSSLQTFSSKEIVVSTIISINPGKSLPIFFSSPGSNSGRYLSQQINFAPAPSILSLNSLKE